MSTLLITLRELFLHPQNVVDAFLLHQKENFTHPFTFIVVVCLMVVAVLITATALFLELPEVISTTGENESIAQIQLWAEVVSRNMLTIFLPFSSIFLLVPALAVCGLVFFRNELNGFYENLILSTYMVAAANLFSLLWLPILLINPELISNSSARVSVAIVILGVPLLWIYQKYFVQKSPISIIRQLSTAASGFVIFIVLSGFISGVLGYMIFAVCRIAELSGQG